MKWIAGLRHAKRYVIAYAATVLAALLLLLAVAFVPQARVDKNIRESAVLLEEEGCYYVAADRDYSSQLDNFTDALILMESAMLRADALDSILTNPRYTSDDPVTMLAAYAADPTLEPDDCYVRYWMGFRVPVRLALFFMNYGQIRRYLAFAFFTLFALTALSVARHVNFRSAFFFMLSIILVKPQIICISLQYSCCFLIAMAAMLLIPYLPKKQEGLFFFLVGMITMYFDFYTTPLLTFGLPLIYLLLLENEHGKGMLPRIGKLAALWLVGYVIMWITKLTLTSVLTPVNGLADGIASLFRRVGITKREDLMQYYSVKLALSEVYSALIPDLIAKCIVLACGFISLAAAFVLFRKKYLPVSRLKQNAIFLLLAVVPLGWFAVAAQPTAIHAYFQHRIVVMSFFAGGAYLSRCIVLPQDRGLQS